MIRVTIYVILLVGLFGGAVALAGGKLGAWEPMKAGPVPGAAEDERRSTTVETGSSRSGAGKKLRPALPQTPEVRRFARQLNSLCRSAKRATAGLETPATSREAERLLERVVRLNRSYNDRFAELTAPRPARRLYARFLRFLEEDERLLDGLLDAVRAADAGRYAAVNTALTRVWKQEVRLMASVGAEDCAASLLSSY